MSWVMGASDAERDTAADKGRVMRPVRGARHPWACTDVDLPDSVQERLDRLAPDQRAAAMAPPGPVLCVAPAGSGKTTTLVARICWRIAIGADPRHVCAVTFNRRAAEELRERLDAALGAAGRARPARSGSGRSTPSAGRSCATAGVDVTRLADRTTVIERLAGGPLPPATMRVLDDAFTRLTLDPERGPPPTEVHIHAAYAAYRAALAADDMIDMDDLVAGALRVLRDGRRRRSRLWRSRAQVLLVDESQDLDRTQLELALLLAGDARDIFLVGDDDQTIYAWRLADVRRILDLAARLPGLRAGRPDHQLPLPAGGGPSRGTARGARDGAVREAHRRGAARRPARSSWHPTRATTWRAPDDCSARGTAGTRVATRSSPAPTASWRRTPRWPSSGASRSGSSRTA